MPSPFPGMDPYIESSGAWGDFHNSFLMYVKESLQKTLTPNYLVRVQERIASITLPDGERKPWIPDVNVSASGDYSPAKSLSPSMVATLEAVELEHIYVEPEKETYLEITHARDRKLVTVIELLSPSNKVNPGQVFYQAKREALLAQYVHIVEIDLLIRGNRLAMKKKLPPGDYFVVISRAEKRFMGAVSGWNVRQPFPTIPIPLLSPDPDRQLDLGLVFNRVYDLGDYGLGIDYTADPPSFLRPEDQEWARGIVAKPA